MSLFNGHTEKVFKLLKLAVAVVLSGGAAAWAGGELAASNVAAKLDQHVADSNRVHDSMAQSVDRAAYDALASRLMMEALLKSQGVPLPAALAPTDAGRDGGSNDGG